MTVVEESICGMERRFKVRRVNAATRRWMHTDPVFVREAAAVE